MFCRWKCWTCLTNSHYEEPVDFESLEYYAVKRNDFLFFFSILGVAGGKHMLIYGGDSQLAVQSARVPSKEQWCSLQGRVMG